MNPQGSLPTTRSYERNRCSRTLADNYNPAFNNHKHATLQAADILLRFSQYRTSFSVCSQQSVLNQYVSQKVWLVSAGMQGQDPVLKRI